MFSFHSVQGVRIGDNSEEIQNKFGKPNSINILEDGLIRIYRYDKYNLNLILKQNKLKRFDIFNPECMDLVINNYQFIDDIIKEDEKKSVIKNNEFLDKLDAIKK